MTATKARANDIQKPKSKRQDPRKKLSKRQLKDNVSGWLFISPVVLGILIFTLYPFLLSMYYSLCDFDNISPPTFIGLENFKIMFGDSTFLHSIRITLIYTIINVPVSLILSFSMALLLNCDIKGMTAFRILLYLPTIVPGVAQAIIWKDLFNPTSAGRFNQVLSWLGLEPFPWLSSPKTALFSMIFMSIWGLAGGGSLLWLSGLKGISKSYYEYAAIEGARFRHRLFNITIPMMSPLIFYNLVSGFIGSLQAFGGAYLLTGGGPLHSTNFIGLNIYVTGLREMNMGYACAQSWIVFILVMLLTLVLFKTGGWVYYGEDQ